MVPGVPWLVRLGRPLSFTLCTHDHQHEIRYMYLTFHSDWKCERVTLRKLLIGGPLFDFIDPLLIGGCGLLPCGWLSGGNWIPWWDGSGSGLLGTVCTSGSWSPAALRAYCFWPSEGSHSLGVGGFL